MQHQLLSNSEKMMYAPGIKKILAWIAFLNMLWISLGCHLIAPTGMDLPEYDFENDSRYVFDYRVGDELEILKQMYLVKHRRRGYSITSPGRDSPSLEKYYSGDYDKRYNIVKILPPGSLAKIVSIKTNPRAGGVLDFVEIDGIDQPVFGGVLTKSAYHRNGSGSTVRELRADLVRKK